MNKWLKFSLIFIGAVVVLLLIARISGMLQFFKAPTPSSEPNVHVGENFLVTNLKHPKSGDLIVFTNPVEDSALRSQGLEVKPGNLYLYRLCAMENETIQMKHGVCYVNGIDVDADHDLYHLYIVPIANASQIPEGPGGAAYPTQGNDSAIVNLTKQQVKEYSTLFPVVFYSLPADTSSKAVFYWMNKTPEWSMDDFGPLIIPPGCGFVMGDNRNNSFDSRYLGFIKLSNIKGVKL